MGVQKVAEDKKNARRLKAWIVFQDESGISQRPPLRRTWAPKGQTPVVTHAFNWKKLSLCGVLGYRWDGGRSRLYFQMTPDSYDAVKLIGFIKELKRHFRGRRVILIWDGLPCHRSAVMKQFLSEQSRWLSVERLPGYAPDLNPVEGLWSNVKGQELANQSADDLSQVAQAAVAGLRRVGSQNRLRFGFLHHAGLSF